MRELAERRANRIPASLKRRAGEEPYDEDSDRLAREQPWLSQVYAASVSWRVAMGPGQVRPGCSAPGIRRTSMGTEGKLLVSLLRG